jgi:ABC-type multidrug transport system fused ATPase/permease subunit
MNDKTLTRLIVRLRPERRRLAVVFPLMFMATGLSVLGPLFLGDALNVLFDGIVSRSLPTGVPMSQIYAELRASGAGDVASMLAAMNIKPGTNVDLTRMGVLLGVTALVYLLAAVTSWARTYLMAGITQRTLFRLREEAAGKLAKLPLRYFDSHPHGEVLSLFFNDIDNLSNALGAGLIQVVASALIVVTTLGVMFWISPLLAGLTLVTVPLAIMTSKPIVRRIRIHAEAQWNSTADLNGLVEETHSGHELVMVYGQRRPMIDEFDRRNKVLRNASFRTQFLSELVGPAMTVINNFNYAAVMVVGGFQVATGAITLGGVQALLMYSRRNFAIPLQGIAGEITGLQSGLASAKRVFAFLDLMEDPGELAGAAPLAALPHAARRVQLEHVSFRYDPDRPLIEDFTLEAAPGQMVAIVGPTGAGKTTLVNLLMRFYEIDSGRILLDGADYRDLSRDEVRRHFGMVLQDTWLFAGTVWDNIAYGRQDASDEEILTAARAAHVDSFVRTLPDGYATVLDSEASNISVGQKQLLTVARAFLANPDILILDEATSNVDTRTEVLIQNAMARLRSGRTSFVIAHRMSTIRDADKIVVMNDGRIVEQGSHAELMSHEGFYHDLYSRSQYAGVLALEL